MAKINEDVRVLQETSLTFQCSHIVNPCKTIFAFINLFSVSLLSWILSPLYHQKSYLKDLIDSLKGTLY